MLCGDFWESGALRRLPLRMPDNPGQAAEKLLLFFFTFFARKKGFAPFFAYLNIYIDFMDTDIYHVIAI